MLNKSKTLWTKEFIIVLLAGFFNNAAQQMSNGTLAIYIDSIGGPASFSGLLAMVFAVASITFRVVSGKLSDRIDGRYIIFVGGIIYAIFTLLYPVVTGVLLIPLLRFFQGVGFASAGTASNAIAAKVAPARRVGEAMSYFGVMLALGSAIGPTVGIAIWRNKGSPFIFYALAFITTLAAAMALLSKICERRPQTLLLRSLEKNAVKATKLRQFISEKKLTVPIITMLVAIPQSFLLTYIVLYGEHKDCPAADYFFLISAVAMVGSRAFLGKSYDHYGAQKTLIPSIVAGIASLIILWLFPQSIGFISGAVLYGVGYGATTTILTAESVRKIPENQKGSAVASYYVGYDLGIGVGALFWGVLIDVVGYNTVFGLAVLFLLFSIYGAYNL